MKYILIIVLVVFAYAKANCQYVEFFINEELVETTLANYSARLSAQMLHTKKAKETLKATKKIKENYTSFAYVKVEVLKSLKNVNSAVKQSKQIKLFEKYAVDIKNNTVDCLRLVRGHRQLVLPLSYMVNDMLIKVGDIKETMDKIALNQDNKDILMDYKQRQDLINELRYELRILRHYTSFMKRKLKLILKRGVVRSMINTRRFDLIRKDYQVILDIIDGSRLKI